MKIVLEGLKMMSAVRHFVAQMIISSILIVPVHAQEDNAGFVICNRSQARILAAIGYYSDGQSHWRLSGWYSIGVDQCSEIGRFDGRFIYYFAEKTNGTYSWPNRNNVSKTFCVPQPRFDRRISNSSCRPSERFLGFAEVPLRLPGVRIELGY